MARLFPAIFLGVAAFLLHVVLMRLIGTQREQIGVLKAFGYPDYRLALHYLAIAGSIALGGALLGIGGGALLGSWLAHVYQGIYRFPYLAYALDTRAVTVRAVLPNPDGRLRAGMLLRVSVRLPVRQALVLPEIAVQQEGSQASVFRVGGGDKVALVPVELGSRREGKVEVTSGLKAGDRIVVDGIVKLHDGSRIVEAAARAAGGAAPAAAR